MDFDEIKEKQHEYPDRTLDIIYQGIDDMLCNGEFDRVDRILSEVITSEFTIEVLLGFLTISLAAKDRLKNRPSLYDRTRDELIRRNRSPEKLIFGLK